MEPKEINDEEYTEFYRFVSNSFDKPRYRLHYRTDAPMAIKALLYVPTVKPSTLILTDSAKSERFSNNLRAFSFFQRLLR